MYVELTREKTCAHCGKSKPHFDFSPRRQSRDGLHSYCKQRRRDQANQRTAECVRSDRRPKRAPRDKPTAWILAGDPRNFTQKLIAATQQKWRYPVEPGVPMPGLGLRCRFVMDERMAA